MPPSSLMIMVAGPYRSGTQDDPQRMAANVRAMEAYALPLFRAGHMCLAARLSACKAALPCPAGLYRPLSIALDQRCRLRSNEALAAPFSVRLT
jgi:hypothetical protein